MDADSILLICSSIPALQVIVSLFNALRATRLAYLQKKHPTLRDNDVRRNFITSLARRDYQSAGAAFVHLTVLPASLCTVSASDNGTLPEGGVHGENWPNGSSIIWVCYGNKFDSFIIFVPHNLHLINSLSLPLCRSLTLSLYRYVFLSLCVYLCVCVFSSGSHSRRGGSRCARWTESFFILKIHW